MAAMLLLAVTFAVGAIPHAAAEPRGAEVRRLQDVDGPPASLTACAADLNLVRAPLIAHKLAARAAVCGCC